MVSKTLELSTKYSKKVMFEEVWGKLESKKVFERQ